MHEMITDMKLEIIIIDLIQKNPVKQRLTWWYPSSYNFINIILTNFIDIISAFEVKIFYGLLDL